jgi:mono/diheme cytochrome c family protein
MTRLRSPPEVVGVSVFDISIDVQILLRAQCATCHGPTAEGKTGPSLKTTKLGEDDVVLLLSKGNDTRKMPHKKAMSSLTDDQIKAVAHYVKSLK